MRLSSPAFQHNQNIPSKYTCDGAGVNPPLVISDVPPGAKSLALLVDDPDAPGGTFVHWIIWNIAPSVTAIAENSVPVGALEGTTSFGKTGWGGPCPPRPTSEQVEAGPPTGVHRYFFKIAALDTTVNLPTGATADMVAKKISPHILEHAEFIGLYQRQR